MRANGSADQSGCGAAWGLKGLKPEDKEDVKSVRRREMEWIAVARGNWLHIPGETGVVPVFRSPGGGGKHARGEREETRPAGRRRAPSCRLRFLVGGGPLQDPSIRLQSPVPGSIHSPSAILLRDPLAAETRRQTRLACRPTVACCCSFPPPPPPHPPTLTHAVGWATSTHPLAHCTQYSAHSDRLIRREAAPEPAPI